MQLDQKKVSAILKKYSIKTPVTILFRKIDDLRSKKIIFPAVLKVDSPDIIHKTDYKLVYLRLQDMQQVKNAVKDAEKKLKELKVASYSFILQEMLSGVELILGMKTDKTFGKVIVFGQGGVFVELYKDTSMRIAPLTKKDAFDMMDGIKAKKILDGFRNMPKVNRDRLAELMLKFSRLCLAEKQISEIDFNPVMANEKDAIVVDARMIENA